MIKISAVESGPNKENWRTEASRDWNRANLDLRQHWLVEVVPRDHLDDISAFLFSDFSNLPENYKKALAKKWGLLK